MTNEIKEILEALKPHNDIVKEYPLTLSIEEQKILLDYITNLQEENETLKDKLDIFMYNNKFTHETLDDLRKRIDKATNYILKNICCDKRVYTKNENVYKVVDILRGDE